MVFKTDARSKRITNQTIKLIREQFFSDQYNFERIKGGTVVDIGASVGDSAIYFALKGAKIVYAYEPFPYAYGMARKNVAANHLDKIIKLHNEGVGGKNSKLGFDKTYISEGGDSITDAVGKRKAGRPSVSVNVITLKSIVDKYKIRHAMLKSDCEGAEYDILLGADDNTLEAFDEIMLEYHYGYINLKERLERAGFDVNISGPTKMLHADGAPCSYSGLIRAKRRDDHG